MKKSLFLAGIIIAIFASTVFAQVGAPGNFEKYEFQPGTWSVPEYGMGDADNRGNLNISLPLASIRNNSGISFDFRLNYSSDVRYTDAAGWIGLGWSSNPGTINRSVQGAFIAEDLSITADPYNYFKSQPVDFPSNLESDHWDGIKDVYSLSLPDGRSTRFIIDDHNVGYANGIHTFISLSGEPWKIEGVFTPGDLSQNLSQCRAFNIISDYRACNSEPVQDYHTFIVTDENGIRFIFRDPTCELSYGRNGRKSVYYSTWRISVIAPPTSEQITDYNNISIPFDQIVRFFYEDGFSEKLDNPESQSHCSGHLINWDVLNEVKYLTRVEAGFERMTIELVKDYDIDLQGYIHYSFNLNKDVVYQLMPERKRIQTVKVERKNGSSWKENYSILLGYENLYLHSFLKYIKKMRNNKMVEPETVFDYFNPSGTASFSFDFMSYWSATREKYTPFNCNFDINGYYKDSKNLYYRHNLPEVGQLTSIIYSTGRKDQFSYSHKNYSLPENLSFKCYFVDNYKQRHAGMLNVKTNLYFPDEQKPDSTQTAYDAFIGRVVRGPVTTAYWSKSLLSNIQTYGSEGEGVYSKTYYFDVPVLVGFPRMLEFNDVNSMEFLDGANTSFNKKPYEILEKAGKTSTIEDQVSFGRIQIFETNKNPITKILPTRKQDFYFIVSPYGTNKAKPTIWAGNAHDFNPEPFYITEFREEKVFNSYKISGSVSYIDSKPLLNLTGWTLGKYFQDQTTKIASTNTRKYYKSGEDVIESQEFYTYAEKGIRNATASFIGYDETQDSSTYQVILDKKGYLRYNELKLLHNFQASVQQIAAVVKLKGRPENVSQFPWNEVNSRFLSAFSRLPSGGSISVTSNKIDFYRYYYNKFLKSRQYSSLKPDQTIWTDWTDKTKIPSSADWALDVENLYYSNAGSLLEARFPEFTAEFFYGNSSNLWSNHQGEDCWGKLTATRLYTVDEKDTLDFSAKYDMFGNLIEANNLNGKMTFSYDNNNRLIESKVNGKTVGKTSYLMNALVQTESGKNFPRLNVIRNIVYGDKDSVFSDHFHNGFWTVQKRTGGQSGVVSSEPFRDLQGREIGNYPPFYSLDPTNSLIRYDDTYTERSGFIPYSLVDREFQLNNMSDENSWKTKSRGVIYTFDTDADEVNSFAVPYKHLLTNTDHFYSFPAGASLSKLRKFSKTYSYIRDGRKFKFSVDEDGKIGYQISCLDDLILETGQIDSSSSSIEESEVELKFEAPEKEVGSQTILKAAGYYYFYVKPGDMLRIKPFVLGANKKLVLTNEESRVNEVKIMGPANVKQQDLLLLPGVYMIDYLALGDDMIVDSILVPIKSYPILDSKKLQPVVYSYDKYRRLVSVQHPDLSVTSYGYDESGLVVKKETPYQKAKINNSSKPESDLNDNPDFRFVYDRLGRLRFSVNPNQSETGRMSYQKYDFWGRPTESGEMSAAGNFTQANADNPAFPLSPSGFSTYSNTELSVKSQKSEFGKDPLKIIPNSRVYYDKAPAIAGFVSKNTRGKQSGKIDYVKSPAGNWFPVKSLVSYDELGRPDYVYEMNENWTLADSLNYFVSGQIKRQITRLNNKFFKEMTTTWSAAGLPLHSFSRIDSTKPPEPLSQYGYYLSGMLYSENIGRNLIDITYDHDTRGWLESVTYRSVSSNHVLFFERMGYFNYSGNSFKTPFSESYTGNISWSSSEMMGLDQVKTNLNFSYKYDLQNRLEKAIEVNSSGSEVGRYNSDYSYDVMGNITTQNKKTWDDNSKKIIDLDKLLYQYSGTQLLNVIDRIKTTRNDDYETTINSVPGNQTMENQVMSSFQENFSSYPVKAGRPASPDWNGSTGFYQTGDPGTAVSIRTETGNQYLCLAPTSPNSNSSFIGKNRDVVGGRQFRLAGRYKGTSTFDGEILRKSQCFAGIEWLSSDGARISVKYILSNGYKTSWSSFSGTLTAPLNAVTARVILINFTAPSTEGHFDDILFEEAGLSFSYDANGNLTKDLNRGIRSITNNTFNLPETVVFENGKSVGYGYNSAGQRVWKKSDTGVVWYLRGFDGGTVAEFSTSTTVPDYINIQTNTGEVKGKYRLESGIWKKYFYVKDHLGNIRQTVREEGNTVKIVSTEDYYPFGSTMRSTTTQQPAFDKFKYQSKERDLETGYDYFEARLYDSQLGRFMQVDPLAEKFMSTNPFVGMGNNPLILVDPTGKSETNFLDENGKLVTSVEDGSNAEFKQKDKGTKKHYEFSGYSDQGGTNEVTEAAVTSVIQEQQNLNMSNSSLQQDINPTTNQQNGQTHCNQATQCVQMAVQSALNAQGNNKGGVVVNGNANEMARNLAKNSNYTPVDMATAESAAQKGSLTIVAFENTQKDQNGKIKPGHVATLSVGSNLKKGVLANIGVKGSTGFVPIKGAKNAAYRAEHAVNYYILKKR
ncbi:MAG: RHS repeat-associated core domain-containing protein [Bacteroidetes bacterium]|nr:RHS repeat-associated core domain-containing protein [Bacteroidota bacterium]